MKLSQEKQDLINKINESDLKQEQKDLWEKVIPFLGDKEAGIMTTFIERDEKTLDFLTKNLKDKLEAFGTEDPKQWDKIIEEEAKFNKSMEDIK